MREGYFKKSDIQKYMHVLSFMFNINFLSKLGTEIYFSAPKAQVSYPLFVSTFLIQFWLRLHNR